MKFIQFFTTSTGYIPNSCPPQFSEYYVKPIEALGSDSIYMLDGRFSRAHCIDIGYKIARKRGFIGFTLNRGVSFTQSWAVTKLILVKEENNV